MSVKLNELRNKGLTFDDFVKRILDYQWSNSSIYEFLLTMNK